MPRGRPKGSTNKPKTTTMTKDKIEALNRVSQHLEQVLMHYRHLTHPSYDDIVKLDDLYIAFRYTFREEIKHD